MTKISTAVRSAIHYEPKQPSNKKTLDQDSYPGLFDAQQKDTAPTTTVLHHELITITHDRNPIKRLINRIFGWRDQKSKDRSNNIIDNLESTCTKLDEIKKDQSNKNICQNLKHLPNGKNNQFILHQSGKMATIIEQYNENSSESGKHKIYIVQQTENNISIPRPTDCICDTKTTDLNILQYRLKDIIKAEKQNLSRLNPEKFETISEPAHKELEISEYKHNGNKEEIKHSHVDEKSIKNISFSKNNNSNQQITENKSRNNNTRGHSTFNFKLANSTQNKKHQLQGQTQINNLSKSQPKPVKQDTFKKFQQAINENSKQIKAEAPKFSNAKEFIQIGKDFHRDAPDIKKHNPTFANKIEAAKNKLNEGTELSSYEKTLLLTISQTTKNAVGIPLVNLGLSNDVLPDAQGLERPVVIRELEDNSFTLEMYQQFTLNDIEMNKISREDATLVTKYKVRINHAKPDDIYESIEILSCDVKRGLLFPDERGISS